MFRFRKKQEPVSAIEWPYIAGQGPLLNPRREAFLKWVDRAIDLFIIGCCIMVAIAAGAFTAAFLTKVALAGWKLGWLLAN